MKWNNKILYFLNTFVKMDVLTFEPSFIRQPEIRRDRKTIEVKINKICPVGLQTVHTI